MSADWNENATPAMFSRLDRSDRGEVIDVLGGNGCRSVGVIQHDGGLPGRRVQAPDPGPGAHRLDRLEPEHWERLYARMMREGAAAGTAHQTHRTSRQHSMKPYGADTSRATSPAWRNRRGLTIKISTRLR